MRLFNWRMRVALVSGVSLLGMSAAAVAQDGAPVTPAPEAAADEGGIEEIIVTAQRQAQSLQDVPIAVSAFSAEALERQQLDNAVDLQQALPNVTFTKTNFTGANLTVRGVGSPSVALSGDYGVATHVNDMPITAPRLFETEFFDLERIELLRGPQGTLFGRNATGGVLNLITARPTDEFEIKAEAEYGNYDSYKATGSINLPLGDTLGVRVAGFYLNRDGYTKNTFTGDRIDGRDQWAVRGTLRWEPTDRTTIDLIGYHSDEDSDRSRIQKQLCARDPTGVLGCAPDALRLETVNGNATLAGVLQSSEFQAVAFAPGFIPATTASIAGQLIAGGVPPEQAGGIALGQARGLLAGLANGSVYGVDTYAGITPPNDVRRVRIDYEPRYKARETIAQIKAQHDFGSVAAYLTAGYHRGEVDSRTDYNLVVANNQAPNATFQALFPAAAAALYQGGNTCASQPTPELSGIYGGFVYGCAPYPTDFDTSRTVDRQYSAELHLDSQFDGPFNFLIGGIYVDNLSTAPNNYTVTSTGLDYAAGLLGGGTAFRASPFFNSATNSYQLYSSAVFGEAYVEPTDNLKFTVGLRYTTDVKKVQDRQTLVSVSVPLGTVDAVPIIDQTIEVRSARLKSSRLTGRAVVDWRPDTGFSEDTLIYASYSRGYKPGGINPPFDPAQFSAPRDFAPETIDAIEIGTKNRFLGGAFQANLTAFYYDYKDLQISRIINRTSFNDNTDAEIYGVEGEFLIAPTPAWLFNINLSYLKTKVKDLVLQDARDPSGGRDDVVIIKDITDASNCVVAPTTTLPPGSAAAFVDAFNAGLNASITPATGNPTTFRPAVPVPGTDAFGAFSICSALAGQIAAGGLPFQLDTGATPTLPTGVGVDLDGNELSFSPKFKASVGAQYTADFGEMNAVFRADLNFTGEQFSRNYNAVNDRIDSYEIVNAQIQLNGANERWYARAFVQNVFDTDAVTGNYVTDASSGLFTNIFTVEPRRIGAAVGVKF